MKKAICQKGIALLLCLTMLLGLVPWVSAAGSTSEEPFVLTFFGGPDKDGALANYSNITFSNPNAAKIYAANGLPVGNSDNVNYLETNGMNVGDTITIEGITGIPYGTYKVEYIYKQGGNRGTAKLNLDGKDFGVEVNMKNTAPSNPSGFANNFRAQTLSESMEFVCTEDTAHTLVMTMTAAGQNMGYGLRFTPVGEPAIKVSTPEVVLDLVDYEATSKYAEVSIELDENFADAEWKSEDESIAVVERNGDTLASVKPVAVGKTAITITAAHRTMEGVSATAQVEVTVTDAGIEMDSPSVAINLQDADKTRQVSATVDDRFTVESWTSSDTDVAAVTGSGITATITAVSEGTATITATAKYGVVTRTAQMVVNVVDGGIEMADAVLDASAFDLAVDIDVDAKRFNDHEWTGETINGQKMSEIYEVNRVAPHATLMPYESIEKAVTGAQDYDREQSAYYMSLTTEEDLDPLTSDWQFAIVDSLTSDNTYALDTVVADPYDAEQNLLDFYKTDYDTSNWPGIAVPSNWNVQGIDENGQPYTGYYDADTGYDPPYYINTAKPHRVMIDGVIRNIYNGVNTPYAPWDYNPVGFYRTTFDVPEAWITNENKVFINFAGVEAVFYVYLNGHEVGYHEDGKTPGEFDLTPFLNADGKDNVLAVKVFRWSDSAWLDNQDFIRLGGIFREVYLMATPALHIQDYKVETDFDSDYKNATLKLDVEVKNYTEALDASGYQVVAQVLDDQGNDILLGNNIILNLSTGTQDGSSIHMSGEVAVAAPHKWFPDDPYLYTLVLSLYDPKTGAIEHISQQLGFREITYRQEDNNDEWDVVRINGKKVMMFGVNRHDSTPDGGHYVSREIYETDLQIMKQNNINTIRTSHYPPDTYLLYLADKYGLMVVLEANNEDHPDAGNANVSNHLADVVDSRVQNIVEREKNRASVIMWSIGNETGTGTYINNVIYHLRQTDDTRPVHYEALKNTVDGRGADYSADVRGGMYISPSSHIKDCTNPSIYRSVYICEFCHASGNALGHLVDFADAFRSMDVSMGGCIWDYVDQSIWTTMEEGEDVAWDLYADIGRSGQYLGYGGDWGDLGEGNNVGCAEGVIDALRNEQPELVNAKKLFQRLNFSASDEELSKGIVNVRNEFYATDGNEYQYKWYVYENGKLYKSGTFDVPSIPASEGGMEILYDLPTVALQVPYELPETLRAGAEYFLKVEAVMTEAAAWAEVGHVVAWEQFELPVEVEAVSSAVIKGQVDVTQTADGYTVTGENFSLNFNKINGAMTDYIVDGELLLEEGPMPEFTRKSTRRDGKGGVRNSIWNNIQERLNTPEITVEVPSGKSYAVVTVKYNPTYVSRNTFITLTYTIYPNGVIGTVVDLTTDRNDGTGNNVMFRFGVDLEMPQGYTDMEYFARGPEDNFVDRLSGTDIGRYSTTVADNFFPFIHPEPTGDHQDARWMALSGKTKRTNLMFVATDNLMGVNALHLTWQEISKTHANANQSYGHPFQMDNDPNTKTTIVSLNGESQGTGGGQNGVLEQYRVTSGNKSFSFTMVPYASDVTDLQAVADPYRRAVVIVEAEKVTLDKSEAVLALGEELTLTATITPENVTDDTLIWTSDNEAVATVEDGKVVAVAAGKATITVTAANGMSAECVISVRGSTEPSDEDLAAAVAAAEKAQASAEAAEAAAKAALTAAEAAQKAAEEAADSAAKDKTAAEAAREVAVLAQEQAQAAKEAAEAALKAAEAAAEAAEDSNAEAAKEAAASAASAAESANSALACAESARVAADAAKAAQEAQAAAEEAANAAAADREAAEKAKEDAEKAAEKAAAESALNLSKTVAVIKLNEYAQKLLADTPAYHAEELAAAAADAREDILAAESEEAVNEALKAAKAELEAITVTTCPAEAFTDVNLDAWYHDALDYVLNEGMMNGTGEGIFAPETALSRAMLVQILYNIEGETEVETAKSFSDVAEGAWYYDAVMWAAENEIVLGNSDGSYAPDANVTREQMVTILWRYAGKPEAEDSEITFADADDIDEYAQAAVAWAVENEIVKGVGDNKFNPDGNSTRAQTAQVMMNYFGK